MEWPIQILAHTPAWVYVLFVYLVTRGIRSLKPAEVTPLKLAIVPVLLTVWSLAELIRLYGVSIGSVAPWVVALALGFAAGWLILRGRSMDVDRARGVIRRPADRTVLPLIIVTFAVKYCFGVLAAVSPQLLAEPAFRLADLVSSGFFAGIFVGKFANYMSRYVRQPARAAA